MGRVLGFNSKQENYCPPPLQLQTFEGIHCVFFPLMRNVFVMHSFCESAHIESDAKLFDISLTDFDKEGDTGNRFWNS